MTPKHQCKKQVGCLDAPIYKKDVKLIRAAIEAARTDARREGEKRGYENALSYLRNWEPATRAIEPNERESIDEAVKDTAHYFGVKPDGDA